MELVRKFDTARSSYADADAKRQEATSAWRAEKGHYDDLRAINLEIEDVERDIQTQERRQRFDEVNEGKRQLALLQRRRLDAVRSAQNASSTYGATDVVSAADVAEVVARSTGIPVARLSWTKAPDCLDLAHDCLRGSWAKNKPQMRLRELSYEPERVYEMRKGREVRFCS